MINPQTDTSTEGSLKAERSRTNN